jgi:hypothetical protein
VVGTGIDPVTSRFSGAIGRFPDAPDQVHFDPVVPGQRGFIT